MTKWTLPDGRKPITDEDLAALTRRLVGTSIDYKERYEIAKAESENQAAAARLLRHKLEILKLDASKHRGQLFHDLQECIALADLVGGKDR
jgi:hypothetical protein